MAFVGTTKTLGKGKGAISKARGKAGRPKLRTKPLAVGGGKDMAALIKEVQEKPCGGKFFKFDAPGDSIAGKLISVREEDGKFGVQLNVTLDTTDGPMTFSCTESLGNMFADEGVVSKTGEGKAASWTFNPKTKGRKVAVMFRESRASGRGHPFKVFALAVK